MTAAIEDPAKVRGFQRVLVSSAKKLPVEYPWRQERSPYNLLIAELMLQRTGVEQVLNVYEGFLEKYPDVIALESANLRTLKRVLAPLGRTSRYVYFKSIGQTLSEEYDGKVPDSYEDLIRLPGIGPYSARAILCFGYEQRVGLLDPNIYRVVSRVFSVNSEKERPHADKSMWLVIDRLLPKNEFCTYNEALIDLGRMVCLKRSPRHNDCILRGICDFAQQEI